MTTATLAPITGEVFVREVFIRVAAKYHGLTLERVGSQLRARRHVVPGWDLVYVAEILDPVVA